MCLCIMSSAWGGTCLQSQQLHGLERVREMQNLILSNMVSKCKILSRLVCDASERFAVGEEEGGYSGSVIVKIHEAPRRAG
jgi:hypothetical protein